MRLILLVDDDRVQAFTRQAVLARTGDNTVSIAESAEAALALIDSEDPASDFDLVVTDHLMPGMDGPALVEALRRLKPALPVLVLSGLPSAENEYEGLNVEFRLKPFPPDELTALVQSMVGARMRRTA